MAGHLAHVVAFAGSVREVWWAGSLIVAAGLLLAAVWFLAVASRRPAETARAEAFRGPARILVFGWFLLAAGFTAGWVITRPGGTQPGWALIVPFPVLFAGACVVWRGRRGLSKVADPVPGRHEKPEGPPDPERRQGL